MKTDALLQELCVAMGYTLLSDMHVNRRRLSKDQEAAVLSIPHDSYQLQDWNNAIGYVTGENLYCKTIDDAITILLNYATSSR